MEMGAEVFCICLSLSLALSLSLSLGRRQKFLSFRFPWPAWPPPPIILLYFAFQMGFTGRPSYNTSSKDHCAAHKSIRKFAPVYTVNRREILAFQFHFDMRPSLTQTHAHLVENCDM